MSLTPASDDPNRAKELKRQQTDPAGYDLLGAMPKPAPAQPQPNSNNKGR